MYADEADILAVGQWAAAKRPSRHDLSLAWFVRHPCPIRISLMKGLLP